MVTRNLKQDGSGHARRVALFGLKALALSAALAAITVLAGPFWALGAVCAALWVALFAVVRDLRKERASLDSQVAGVRDKYDSLIGALCGAMNLKDDLNSTHTGRVGQLASLVATELGMRRDELRLLRKATILKDIGKIEIAENIITKPGALTEQEWAEMKRHPEFGHDILSGISHLRDAGDIVLAHHERFDGQGYPRGLKSDDIPLGARILSVVDAYTAMTSDRPHRKKMGHDIAVKEILRNSLTQFDPEVVRAFVRCEERGLIAASAAQPTQPEPKTESENEQMQHSVPVRAAGAA